MIDIDPQDRDLDLGNVVIQPIRPTPLTSPVIAPISSAPAPGSRPVRISGRITDLNGTPLAEKVLNFRNLTATVPYQAPGGTISILETDRDGTFVFPCMALNAYEVYITEPGVATYPTAEGTTFTSVGEIEVANAQGIDFGNIVLHAP